MCDSCNILYLINHSSWSFLCHHADTQRHLPITPQIPLGLLRRLRIATPYLSPHNPRTDKHSLHHLYAKRPCVEVLLFHPARYYGLVEMLDKIIIQFVGSLDRSSVTTMFAGLKHTGFITRSLNSMVLTACSICFNHVVRPEPASDALIIS